MSKIKTKKKTLNKRAKKTESKQLPQSAMTASVAHGYSNYNHSKELPKKMNEKTQRLIMWTSIGAIMTIIVVVWILNLNTMIKAQSPAPLEEDNKKAADLEVLKKDLQETLSQVKTGMNELQQLSKTTETAKPSTITGTELPQVTPSITPNTLPN